MPPCAPRFTASSASAVAACLFGAFLLGACLDGGDAPPRLGLGFDDAFFAHVDTFRIVSHAAPSGSSPGVLVRRATSERCEGGEIISDTTTDTTLYSLGSGVLRSWNGGDCLASRLVAEGAPGKRSTLSGTWFLEGQDSVAAAWRPAACAPEELDYAVGPTGSWVFSKELAVFRTNGAFCLARIYGERVARSLGGVQVSKGCDEVTLRVGKGEATLSGEIAGDGVRLRLTRADADTVCEGMWPVALRPPATCPASGPSNPGGAPEGDGEAAGGLDALSGCLADFFLEFRETR